MSWGKLILTLTGRSLRHPSLGIDLLRVSWRFRNRHWFRHFPFLPIPDRDYLRWRMYTAYGSADTVPPARDLERYARWAARE
jgi:hypothetical protein